jgi:branched-chain amino acid transport system substrate-binding protein
MKGRQWDDPIFGKSWVRPDGRKMHDFYLFEVKAPAESKGPWDYYKQLATIPADEAFRPMDQGNCPMVAKKN